MKFPLYTLAYALAATAAGPVYLIRGLKRGKYFWNLSDRLGLSPLNLPPKQAPRVWVHALSLGETTTAGPLIEALLAEGLEVCLSTTTHSGWTAAARAWPDLPRFSLPFDLPGAVRRRLKEVDPDLFLLIETDIWPNLVAELKNQGLPLMLLNARISPRSLAGYGRIRGFWSRVLNCFDHLVCQTSLDRERLIALGADPVKTIVVGNLKFDRPRPETGPELKEKILAETGLPDGLWLVAGSTHPGEEEILLDLLESLAPDFPDLRLLPAPRNAERFEAVRRLIEERGLESARRSGPAPGPGVKVFLLDTLGELDRFYELADIVFIGKSLALGGEGGGHNPLEPAGRAKPILFGPRMHNFQEMARLLVEAGGALTAADAQELKRLTAELAGSEEKRRDMGRRARAFVEEHRGALGRTLDLIRQALENRKGKR